MLQSRSAFKLTIGHLGVPIVSSFTPNTCQGCIIVQLFTEAHGCGAHCIQYAGARSQNMQCKCQGSYDIIRHLPRMGHRYELARRQI